MTFIDLTENDSPRQRNLSGIFTTAIEGGMTSGWARIHEYNWNAPYNERRAVLTDREDGVEYTLTPDLMEKGLRRWYEAEPTRVTECHAALSTLVNLVDDPGWDFGFGFDAIDADVVVQYALLGELTYG